MLDGTQRLRAASSDACRPRTNTPTPTGRHGPRACSSAARGRAAREMEAGPQDLGQGAGGHRGKSYRIVITRRGRGCGAYRQNPALLLFGVILLALLSEGSRVILTAAVERRLIGGSKDGRRERIGRNQPQPRQERRRCSECDQESPQRFEHVGERKVNPPKNLVYVTPRPPAKGKPPVRGWACGVARQRVSPWRRKPTGRKAAGKSRRTQRRMVAAPRLTALGLYGAW